METKTNESKPAEPQQNTPEALTPEQLEKVSGGTEPLGVLTSNHNQNVV